MARWPRVVLLLYPHAGYDRCILQGITQYPRVHGPWIFYVAGEEQELPLPQFEAVSRTPVRTIPVGKGRRPMRLPDLRRWATGIIGRLQTPEIARMALEARVPVIALDLADQQLADRLPASRISEVRPDSAWAGRLAAEHLLERGFQNFAYCGYEGRVWSERRCEGFCGRLAERGLSCHIYRPPKRGAPLAWSGNRPP